MSTRFALKPADVMLVQMPYASLKRPSIALSILKSVLTQADISCSIFYANLIFAEEIGIQANEVVGGTLCSHLNGEWTFSSAAFPGFEPDEAAYFKHVALSLKTYGRQLSKDDGEETAIRFLRLARARSLDFTERMAQKVLRARPKIVGCTSLFQQHCASLALLRVIKQLDPSVITVMGGANCEASMGVATHEECPWIDYVASGESEDSFLELCRRLLKRPGGNHKGLSPKSLLLSHGPLPEGIIGPEHRARGAAGYQELYKSPPRARLENMDRSPAPDYDDFMEQLERSPVGKYIEPGLLMETSRGCWWGEISHCTFCGLNGGSMGYRAKSAERVLGEIKTMADRYGSREFEVVDNILDLDYFKTVLPELAKAGLGYQFFYETKANLSKAHLDLMAEAGIRFVQPGIECLDDELLKALAKGTTIRKNLEMLKWSLEVGIRVIWLILFEIPGEADESYTKLASWLPLVEHLEPPRAFAPILFERFSPYHMRPGEYGITVSPERSYQYVYPWKPESIWHFAYFFDDYTQERDVSYGEEPRRPGLRQMRQALRGWHDAWGIGPGLDEEKTARPVLIATRKDGQVHIRDTRACRVREHTVLDGLAARVYEVLDHTRNRAGLIKELKAQGLPHQWEQIGPIVEALVADKLVLSMGPSGAAVAGEPKEGKDEWYFSLAVQEPRRPLLPRTAQPAGRFRTAEQIRAIELQRDAEQLLAAAGNW